jgi:endonuclease/exonuclease/phosphatase family metal-dependent hydrolase
MTFRGHSRPTGDAKGLVVVTHNVGEGNRQQFFSFLEAENPDVIALQDARFRGVDYASRFRDRYVAASGEFCLISRHLIQQSKTLEAPKWHGRPVAARYEIICEGQPLIIYNVHMPTPRGQFNHVFSRRFVRDLFVEDEGGAPAGSYREWIDARVELARGLARVFAAEKQPFIACGDFNMPDHGYIYHLFAGEMTDAFAHAGRGWGLTFPGETRNPAAFFGPWLRLDFAFAGRGWKPVFCAPESGRKSQHRAVVAHFVPTPP